VRKCEKIGDLLCNLVPEGKPGAGKTVKRGAYSTNGFSLVGLALSGVFNLTDWADLDQNSLAWGAKKPSDDATLFPTRGPCRCCSALLTPTPTAL